jgi:hypothetical protein
MAKQKIHRGKNTMIKDTGLSGTVLLGLEAAGILNPIKVDSGWRAYSETDYKAALRWKAAQTRALRSGPRREAVPV